MKPRDRSSLQDITEQVRIIQQYTAGYTYEEFLNDSKSQDAVIRRFEIIGEAATCLPDEFRSNHPEVDWQGIRNMRNFLIHVYHAVDMEIIWKTIQEDIGPLLNAVERILAKDTTSD